MTKRLLGVVVAVAVVAACASFSIRTASGDASGNQVVQSGPHVYDQTTAEYASDWGWSQDSSAYDYYWYVFRSSGVLQASGHSDGGGGSWSGAANVYYFKEYNNEPLGSGHANVLSVDYCC